MSVAKFSTGRLLSTPGALAKVCPEEMFTALSRHVQGDWGDVDEHDREENELSLQQRLRLFSVYHTQSRLKFWIITEADRTSTTVLLPEEY